MTMRDNLRDKVCALGLDRLLAGDVTGAILRALDQPTDEMIAAGDSCEGSSLDKWRAMLRAIDDAPNLSRTGFR